MNSANRRRIWDTLRRAWHASRLIRVRLRFIVVLLAMAIVVGKWEWLSTYFNRWVDPWLDSANEQAVSPDTEYFCPMCPGVLSPWPDTCPVCNMPLVRRRKGEATLLPTGVVARMQFSPQRIQLAGLQTSPVQYRELRYELTAVGRLATSSPSSAGESPSTNAAGDELYVVAQVPWADVPLIAAADQLQIAIDPPDGTAPWQGRALPPPAPTGASGLATIRVAVASEDAATAAAAIGRSVRVRWGVPAARVAPMSDQPRGLPELRKGEPHVAYLCADHADEVHVEPGRCPHDDRKLESLALAADQRIRWTCPDHAELACEHPDDTCPQCRTRQTLVPRIVTFAPENMVLSIPESAVVDTGHEKLVYWESSPGMFDGVRVQLGRRAGAYYPVLGGLSRGQRVVTRGAFLVDAESRLNPNIASTYFGAGGTSSSESNGPPAAVSTASSGPASTNVSAAKRQEARLLLAKFDMPAADRKLAEQQAVCPVTGMPLGSMGLPPKRTVDGKTVFLCCAGCDSQLKSSAKSAHAPEHPADHDTPPSSQGSRRP